MLVTSTNHPGHVLRKNAAQPGIPLERMRLGALGSNGLPNKFRGLSLSVGRSVNFNVGYEVRDE